jgi:glyoxylase-like metal-dependent hydrolase (beta-lactamase superfamily II)
MTDSQHTSLPDDLRLVDLQLLGLPRLNGTYVLLGDEPALVDPGPASTLGSLEAGLAAHGLTLDDVRALLLTHIHLDHAGATGTLVARYPALRVYVHQRGVPHLMAPERLLRSAGRLYGDLLGVLWGEVRPVPERNLIPLSGGEVLRLGGRLVRVYDTPGHAYHHVAYFDEGSGAAFVGDVAGVRLPGMPYVRPATPPPEVDLEAWQGTLDTLRALGPDLLLLFHFGPVTDPAEHIEQLRARLLRWAEAVRLGLAGGEDEPAQIAHLQALADEELGPDVPANVRANYELVTPVEQSWQGLARYWHKRGRRQVEG